MLSSKRVVIATLCGLVFGFVCWYLATSNPEAKELAWTIQLNIILSRTLMGFMIGVSALKIRWWGHGLLLGFIGSIPLAVSVLGDHLIFVGTFVMGMIYGFLTELITTVLFKAKSAAYQGT